MKSLKENEEDGVAEIAKLFSLTCNSSFLSFSSSDCLNHIIKALQEAGAVLLVVGR